MRCLLKRNYIYNSGIKDPTGGSTDKAAIERMRKQARLLRMRKQARLIRMRKQARLIRTFRCSTKRERPPSPFRGLDHKDL